MSKVDLNIDWCSHKAAKYAVEHWHYSKCLPAGKLVKVGVWENQRFIGCVLFGRGANYNMLKPYGLGQDEGCELVRVALSRHKTEVTKIISIAIKFLKNNSPKLKMIVSYADPEQGHIGTIYQGGNWIYDGLSGVAIKVWYKGKWTHKKTVDDAGVNQTRMKKKKVAGKHRYLMPLEKHTRKKAQRLSKTYPKKQCVDLAEEQQKPSVDGGATPTSTLHIQEVSNG